MACYGHLKVPFRVPKCYLILIGRRPRCLHNGVIGYLGTCLDGVMS